MIQRTCRMCGREFWSNAHNTLYCEDCGKERIRQSRAKSGHRYYQEHKDELLAKSRQKYRDDPSQRKEINRKYYEEHSEEIKERTRIKAQAPEKKAYQAEYQRKNKDRIAAQRKAHYKAHADEIKEKRQTPEHKAYQAEYYRKNRDRIVAQRKAKREMDKQKESTD